MNTVASLFAYKTWADAELLALLDHVAGQIPPDALHATTRTFNHLHVVDRIFRAHLGGGRHSFSATNTPDTPTLAGLRAAVGAGVSPPRDLYTRFLHADEPARRSAP